MKLSARLPSNTHDGTGPAAAVMLTEPHRRHVLLVIVDCDQIATDTDTDVQTPRARILRVETVHESDWATALRLFRRAWGARQHDPHLPFDGEADEWGDLFTDMTGTDRPPVPDIVDEAFAGPIHEGPEAPVLDSTDVAVPEDDRPDDDPFTPPKRPRRPRK